MGVVTAGIAAKAARPEKLTIRGRCQTVTKRCGEWFTLLLIDQTLKRQDIGLLTDVPIRCPGQLAETGDAAGFSHAREREVKSIGSVAEIPVLHTMEIRTELLRRPDDGLWPLNPLHLVAGDEVALESIGFTAPLAALYRTSGL